MKLHEALRQIVRQSGTQVLQEQRLMYLLPDYRAYDEYPAVKQVMKAIIADGYAKVFMLAAPEPADPAI